MRILYFLSAVMLVVVLIVGCTGDPKGIVDPVQKTGMVPPPPGGDSDGDGVLDGDDNCSNTPSGVVVNADGCSIDQLCPCDGGWNNHGQYVSCVAHTANAFKKAGLITGAQKGAIVAAAAQADCPPPPSNPCDNSLCVSGNTSECVNNGDGSYTCVCNPGFTGMYCEIDPCAFSACQNGGECVRGDDGTTYTCICPPGYTGTNCETEIDECAAGPCVNGDCTDLVNGYECSCLPGWTGTNCDVPE